MYIWQATEPQKVRSTTTLCDSYSRVAIDYGFSKDGGYKSISSIQICVHSGILLCELLLELSLEMVCHLHLQPLTAYNTKNLNQHFFV